MKYVVFADVHGNQYALRAMLNDTLGKADGYLFLGDISGYYYGQRECRTLMERLPNAIFLKGNHDVNYVDARAREAARIRFAAAYGNSYLTDCGDDYKIWVDGMPLHRTLRIDGRSVGLFHGSPADPQNGRSYPDTELMPEEYAGYDVVFQGHTHYRMARMAGETQVMNPGSLGQPRDGLGFSYGIFDFTEMKHTFHTVRFDKDALRREIQNNCENDKNKHYLLSVLERGEN